MDEMTRRAVFGATALAGAASLTAMMPAARADDKPGDAFDEKADRERIIACGFTEAEADCWVLLGRTAGKFLSLPKLHVMDDHEIAHAIHILQYRLLSRPAYRKYTAKPQDAKNGPAAK